jgi:hypothetical protein
MSSFHFNATNQQNQIGDNNTQTQNIAGGEPLDIGKFFEALSKTITADPAPLATAEAPSQEAPSEEDPAKFIEELQQQAEKLDAKEEVDPADTEGLLGRFRRYVETCGPKIADALVTFAIETGKAYIGENPIAIGVLKAIEVLRA